MNTQIYRNEKQIQLLEYLSDIYKQKRQIPTLNKMSRELGISISSLREQIEVPKALGIVTSGPKNGILFKEYSFTPAVLSSISYALKIDQRYFWQYSKIRRVLEESFFIEAAQCIKEFEIHELVKIVETAREKLNQNPIQIPHAEHKQFHLKIYSELDNVFVKGLLEGYWHVYESFGLNVYTNYEYLQNVWDFHERITQAILEKDYSKGQFWLITHMGMISQR